MVTLGLWCCWVCFLVSNTVCTCPFGDVPFEVWLKDFAEDIAIYGVNKENPPPKRSRKVVALPYF